MRVCMCRIIITYYCIANGARAPRTTFFLLPFIIIIPHVYTCHAVHAVRACVCVYLYITFSFAPHLDCWEDAIDIVNVCVLYTFVAKVISAVPIVCAGSSLAQIYVNESYKIPKAKMNAAPAARRRQRTASKVSEWHHEMEEK